MESGSEVRWANCIANGKGLGLAVGLLLICGLTAAVFPAGTQAAVVEGKISAPVASASQDLRLVAPQKTQTGFEFGLSGATNRTYTLQVSDDLDHWTDLQVLPKGTVLGQVPLRAASDGQAFYRLIFRPNLILNGSFESPPIQMTTLVGAVPTSWYGGSRGAWLASGNASGQSPESFPGAQDGRQYASPGKDYTQQLSQNFSVKTGTCTLSWYDAVPDPGQPFNNTANYTAWISLFSNTLSSTPLSQSFSLASASWQFGSFKVVLAEGQYTLNFQGTGPLPGQLPLIDNVSLEQTSD